MDPELDLAQVHSASTTEATPRSAWVRNVSATTRTGFLCSRRIQSLQLVFAADAGRPVQVDERRRHQELVVGQVSDRLEREDNRLGYLKFQHYSLVATTYALVDRSVE